MSKFIASITTERDYEIRRFIETGLITLIPVIGRVISPDAGLKNAESENEVEGRAHRKRSEDGIISLKSRPSSSAAGPKIVPLEEPDSQVFIGDEELKTITDDILKTVEGDDSEDQEKAQEPASKKSFDAVALAGLEPIAEEKKDAEGDSVTDTLDTDRQ
ncbi:uncharacterized protein LOC119589386 [Penaeus monodon]|uniref:uncharacterized protein LOC119589386 n=1 Tax=Penaeus monodon TaxID=6687 RepID=UPI0018A72B19|nr:uncharacterized protein LOC119589386 [Penaeus monodon]